MRLLTYSPTIRPVQAPAAQPFGGAPAPAAPAPAPSGTGGSLTEAFKDIWGKVFGNDRVPETPPPPIEEPIGGAGGGNCGSASVMGRTRNPVS